MTDSKTVKQPVKRVLKPVPDHGAYVHSSKTKFNDQFALPGSVPEPGKYHVDSSFMSLRTGLLTCIPTLRAIARNCPHQHHGSATAVSRARQVRAVEMTQATSDGIFPSSALSMLDCELSVGYTHF
jgi:hypothetical protein